MKKDLFSRTAKWIGILCLFCQLLSCKKPTASVPENMSPPVISPIGTPIADALVETMDALGGTIKSEDGRLVVEIPAGALTTPTEISIQPIQNTAAGGIGFGYRLSPHGKTFQKKVTIRFHYAKDVSRLSSKQALEIAFQNEKGIWTCAGGTTNDTVRHIIRVQTDHFSDWGLIPSMEVTPVVKAVGLSEQVTLKAVQYVFPQNGDDFLVPLALPNATTGVAQKLNTKYIVRWTLNGPGTLTSNGAEAVYKSPSAKPVQKSATVTCELNVQGKQVLLISTIHILEEGISLLIDGGDWQTYPAMAIGMPSLERYHLGSLRTTTDIPEIVIQWPMTAGRKSDGVYGWNMLGNEETHVVFEYATPGLKQMYVSIYDDGVQTWDSPGFFAVEEKEEGGKKYVTGMFAVDKAGLLNTADGQQVKVSGIAGTFNVQRNW